MVPDPHLPKMCGLVYPKRSSDIVTFSFLLCYKSLRRSSFGQNQGPGQHATAKGLVHINAEHAESNMRDRSGATNNPVHKSLRTVHKSHIRQPKPALEL